MRFNALLVGSLVLVLTSCAPNPRNKLTAEQRQADMMWLITKIDSQYAPLKYKEAKHSFSFEQLKKEYLEKAYADQSNEDFYLLMHGLIAKFKDGHMSGGLNRSTLPGRSKVAYLGIKGSRTGDTFTVESFFPAFENVNNYPIQVNDEILELDGKTVKEAVDQILIPVRDIGNKESNYTGLMGSLFARDSLNQPMPANLNAKIKLKRAGKTMEVEVPWITQDYNDFYKEQQEATKKKAEAQNQATAAKFSQDEASIAGFLQISGTQPLVTESLVRNIIKSKSSAKDMIDAFLSKAAKLKPYNTFEYQRSNVIEDTLELFDLVDQKLKADDSDVDTTFTSQLAKTRFVPEKITPIEGSNTYPAYVATILNAKDKKRYSVGYIRIETFSPAGSSDDVIKEFKGTLKAFRDYGPNGVDKLVIDTIDNGGGSLELGLEMAQLLSSEEIKLPGMEVMMNDNWLDSLESASITANNPAEREIARRAFKEAHDNGNRMSPLLTAESVFPMAIKKNDDLVLDDKPFKFKIVVAINEMCASMCDIFALTLKNNEMATFVGKQTMGAGGNVVNHYQAPNSGFNVRLTESLIKDKGEYLENNGVKPDVEIEVSKSKIKKYDEVVNKAFDTLINPPAPVKEEKKELPSLNPMFF